ncbi:NACHT domain-containing protein [Acinetobacter junii]|uniref:NACHT domain-containing protein n=1 Tax=Acinetobacter junii TaxID=40215 RepID=UPI0030160A1C
MLKDIITDLIKKEECLWLEFKSYWYWENNKNKSQAWNEFLKDFSAIFNTADSHRDNVKYMIIGFDEKTNKHNNYYESKDNSEIADIKNIDLLKKEIISKLKKRFKNTPNFKESDELKDIETFFNIHIVDINGFQNLVFIFEDSPYLLEQKENLNDGFRAGSILVRELKADKTPEVVVADYRRATLLLEIINKNRLEKYPEKETTIEKIVNEFTNKYMHDAIYLIKDSKRDYQTNICYEIFKVKNDFSNPVSFIYFTSHTSQNKTFNYIKDEIIKNKNEKIIVLLDKKNKSGGIIDIGRIKELFLSFYTDVDVYYVEDFALQRLYKDLFASDIFYKGQQLNPIFIKPYTTNDSTKTADLLIYEWYTNNNNPLLVLKGSGGVGKTTVAKNFIERLYKNNLGDNTNILYINSHDLINEIMKADKIEDIFDFYLILATKRKENKIFSKELLQLSSDNGNLTIVLDGIDEVIARKGSDFNLNTLIESIFKSYSGNLNKTKIIMTCRDYFWEISQNFTNIELIELKPFDEQLARKYFESAFEENPENIKKSMVLANKFKLNNNSYIPYILDMIKDNIISFENNLSHKLKTLKLQINDNVDDFLIAKSCEREIVKLDNLSIDEQIEIFLQVSIKYDGIFHESHLKEVLSRMFSEKNLDKFKDHSLLIRQGENLVFRYDFFVTHFKCLYLFDFLLNEKIESMDQLTFDILVNYINLENDFSKNLKERLGESYSKRLEEIIYYIINKEIVFPNFDQLKVNEITSSLLILLLNFYNEYDTKQRSDLIQNLYENGGQIENLSIINLHSKSQRVIFDFSNLKFNNCHFENYEGFAECKFNNNTLFKNTVFKPNLIKKGVTTSLTSENIDDSTCNTSGIYDFLQEKEELKNEQEQEIRKNLRRIITYFWQGSFFVQKLASEARNRFKHCMNLFSSLIDLGVIIESKVTTQQKRQDIAYQISTTHISLKKIFEENDTCVEFELILRHLEQV